MNDGQCTIHVIAVHLLTKLIAAHFKGHDAKFIKFARKTARELHLDGWDDCAEDIRDLLKEAAIGKVGGRGK
jgi:hypothetical protein